MRLVLKSIFILFLLAASSISHSQQVPEIPNTMLNDIAMVSWHNGPLPPFGNHYNGPIIVYNPNVTNLAGPHISEFFYAHEYCHIFLQHIQRRYFETNPLNSSWLSKSFESEADSCATETLVNQGNIAAVIAAAQWFYGQGYISQVSSHPPGAARADNIVSIARKMGVKF